MINRELDHKAAIMIVIEHLGDLPPGTKCSAVFFDKQRVLREKDFYSKLYSQNGVHDLEILRAMVASHVPEDPYWLVSFKPADGTFGQEPRMYRVDDRTGKVLADQA